MSAKLPFHANDATVAAAVTTGSSATIYAIGVNGQQPQVQITNQSTAFAFVNFGSSTVEASFPTTSDDASGYVIPPSGQVVLTPGLATYVAGILSSSANNIYLTPGTGGS